MAITRWKPPASSSPALAETLAIDPTLLSSRVAQEARRKGILIAKHQALASATALLAWGRLLTWAIMFVSALHIWETIAAIAPEEAGTLHLPPWIYHGAALAFTLMIDACALYIARANAAAAFVGAPPTRWTLFFYGVTALLNASFVARYAPAIDPNVQAALLPLLGALFVVLLPLCVPVGIVAVEAAGRTLEATRLTLLVEVTTLRELAAGGQGSAEESARKAAASVLDETGAGVDEAPTPLLDGGRPVEYRVADLVRVFGASGDGGPLFGPADARQRLGCSDTTARRLIAAGVEVGLLERAGRGAYRVRRSA